MKQNVVIIVFLVLSIFIFLGGVTYVIIQANNSRDNICSEVQDLRNDIVQVLDLSIQANKNEPDYDPVLANRLRTIVSKPSC